MRRHLNTLLRLTAGILLIPALGGCETIDELVNTRTLRPDATLRAVRLTNLALDRAALDFDLEVRNPYDVPLPVADIEYGLASTGRSFLSGAADIDGLIPARGTRTFTLPAEVDFAELLTALRDVRPGGVVAYTADVAATVDAPGLGPIRLPVQKSGELPVPAPPRVSVESIDWGGFSLTEASGVIRLNVENPNAFRADLQTLDYRFALAGADLASAQIASAASLQPGGAATIDIPISFSPANFGSSILNIVQGESASYRIGGDMSFGTPFGPISLPFERTGTAPMTR